jgi:hypothetical protein
MNEITKKKIDTLKDSIAKINESSYDISVNFILF